MIRLVHGVAALLAATLALGEARAARPEAAAACAACHGEQGVSELPEVPSLAAQPATFLALQMILFREGLRDAAAMEGRLTGIDDSAVEAIAAWYASLPPPPRAEVDAAAAREGAALAERLRCASCHAQGYQGVDQVPRLSGQRPDYLLHALVQYRGNVRAGSDTTMNGVVHGLTDAQLRALAEHSASP